MNYRVLASDEIERLKFIFEPRNLPLPDPDIERVVVAENDDKIVGMLILRLLPMIDGLWVSPEYRGGKVDYTKMVDLAEAPVKALGGRTYVLAPTKTIATIAEQNGYQRLSWNLFKKEH